MDVELKRDGILLQGRIDRACSECNQKMKSEDAAKAPALIIFHGFAGNLGYEEKDLYNKIAKRVASKGVNVIRFDFDGHGKSGGEFSDMDVLREILDGIAILKYVRSLSYVSEIYVLGHSQGGVVGGMLSGLYPDMISKLILLAPAAALKDDAIHGTCMGTEYDTEHIPEKVLVDHQHLVGGHYFRIAKYLPIYEVSEQFRGPVLLIHGRNDLFVDYHYSEKYHELWPDSRLRIYEHLDHGIEGLNQEEVFEEIEQFIAE